MLFPRVTNQEMNRSLKVIGEICGIRKNLSFHLARHTFATTVTLYIADYLRKTQTPY
jgi:site-specific recombinase XerD